MAEPNSSPRDELFGNNMNTVKLMNRGDIPVFIAPVHTDTLAKYRAQLQKRKLLIIGNQRGSLHTTPLLPTDQLVHPLNTLKAIWYLLGYTKEEISDVITGKFSWTVARQTLTQSFLDEMVAFDPAADDGIDEAELPPYQRIESIKKLMDSVHDVEVLNQGPAFTALYGWARVAVDIKSLAVEQRDRVKILRDADVEAGRMHMSK